MKHKIFAVLLCILLLSGRFIVAAPAQSAIPFSDEDLNQTPDFANAISVSLDGASAKIGGKEAAQDGVLTIPNAGEYLLSGSFQGQVLVDCGKQDRVTLVLDSAAIRSENSAAIYIKKAESVILFLMDGTENRLENGGTYLQADANNVDAALFSKTDLLLCGDGALTLTAEAGHGIVSKDTLTIAGGDYTISAAGHGIVGKDSLSITGGSFDLTSGGGSENGQMKPSDAAGMMQRQRADTDTENHGKGIRSDGPLTILSGSFRLDCADDAIHAAGDLHIAGGDWEIRTADDAIHTDANARISGGSFSIPYCYEGIEGQAVTISGGSFNIRSTDDGINATGGSDGGEGWGSPFAVDENAVITVSGGSITIVSDGDCLDSNGSIVFEGGTLNLTCNGYGNTAIDYESSYTNNGAEVTTNDGSENGDGFPLGRGGFGRRRLDGTESELPDGFRPEDFPMQKGKDSGAFGPPPDGGMFPGFGRQKPDDAQGSRLPS